MANPFVSSVISTAPVGASLPGFGTPLLLSYNAGAFGAERVRYYAGLDEVAVDFTSTTGPEYLAARALFSQSVRPRLVGIGRGALPPTQVYVLAILSGLAAGQIYRLNVMGDGVTSTSISVTALADLTFTTTHASETLTTTAHGMTSGDGPYRLTNSGGALPAGFTADTNYWIINLTANTYQLAATYADAVAGTPVPVAISGDGTGTHTLARDANDVIVAQLVDRLNSVVGKNYTAAQTAGAGDTDTITITASAAGEWFSIEVPDADLALVSVAQTHVDPGVATDLAAIGGANDSTGWYTLHTFYNSNAYVMAAAAWIETQNSDPRRMYHAGCCNSLGATAAVGGAGNDTLDNLKTAAYARTTGLYHTSPGRMLEAAFSGRILPKLPGAIDPTGRRLVGDGLTLSLTTTQKTNLDAKFATYYTGAEGVATTVGGKTASGEWWDVTRNDDYANVLIRVGMFNWRQANDIVPFDDDGIASAEGELTAILARLDKAKIYTSIVVVAQLVADVSSANRTARRLPLSWSATRVGAIVFVDATGTVS